MVFCFPMHDSCLVHLLTSKTRNDQFTSIEQGGQHGLNMKQWISMDQRKTYSVKLETGIAISEFGTDEFDMAKNHCRRVLQTENWTCQPWSLFYTQALLHTDAFTHRGLYTDTLLHTVKSQFFLSFWRPTSISCVRVAIDTSKSQFFPSFWRPTSISCVRVAIDTSKSQFFLSFWRPTSISCVRVAIDTSKSQFFPSFWRPTSISCERVAADASKSQFYLGFGRLTSISCERVAFRGAPAAPPPPKERIEEEREEMCRCEGVKI